MAKRLEPSDLAKNGTEHGEQAALICWCYLPEVQTGLPDARKLYCNNNNAGLGDAVRGNRAKMSGVKKGVADLFLPVARHGKHGLYIELKVKDEKKGRLSVSQKEFGQQVMQDGYGWLCCFGWEEAARCITLYLEQ